MSVYDLNMVKALPSDAVYNVKPMAFQGLKRSRLSITPYTTATITNTTNNLVSFYLPSNRKALLDGTTMYLKFRITATTSSGANAATNVLNKNGFSFWNQLTIYHQDSVMLEQINNYNNLCHIINESQLNRSDLNALSPLTGAPDSVDPANAITGLTLGAAPTRLTASFAIPVVSGFCGMMANKLVPLWASSDIRLDFLTELPNVAISNSGANESCTGYTITDMEIVVDIIELTDEAFLAIKQTYQEPLVIASTSFRNYTQSISNGTLGAYSALIPHRSVSVKGLFYHAQRVNTNQYDSFARVSPFGSDNLQAYLTLAGIQFPAKPIVNFPESFAEYQKFWHGFSSLINNGSINRTNYQVCRNTPAGSRANSLLNQFVGGFDLDQISRRSDLIISGYNSSGINIYLNGYVSDDNNAATALGAAITLQTYVMYDLIFVLQDGLWSVRY